MKREDYIRWDEYFMGISKLAGMRSKDPNTQVGACIVGEDNKILSMGYNGFPNGCSDEEFPWDIMKAAAELPFPAANRPVRRSLPVISFVQPEITAFPLPLKPISAAVMRI